MIIGALLFHTGLPQKSCPKVCRTPAPGAAPDVPRRCPAARRGRSGPERRGDVHFPVQEAFSAVRAISTTKRPSAVGVTRESMCSPDLRTAAILPVRRSRATTLANWRRLRS